MSILNVEHLSHGFGDRAIFQDVSFRLLKGEHIGLVGANGEGKSTFMSIITGKLQPDEGKVEWAKHVRAGYLDQHTVLEKGMTIRDVLKSAFSYLFEMETQMNEICDRMGMASEDEMNEMMEELGTIQDLLMAHDFYIIDSKVEEVARALGLLEIGLDKDVSELSGGQRTKVLLGKLLLEKPDILLLDEPTNYLDEQHIEWLKRYLQEYENAFILISHDVPFMNSVINLVYHMENQKLDRYVGDYHHFEEVYAAKKAQLEAAYKRQQQEIAELEDFVARNKARVSTRNMAMSRQKKLDKMEVIELAKEKPKPEFQFMEARTSGKLIFETKDLVIGYDEPLTKPVNLMMERGEKVVLRGANGIGKTTLLKSILGLIPSLSGSVELGDYLYTGYFEQEMAPGNTTTCIEEIWKEFPSYTQYQVRSALAKCGLTTKHIESQVRVLSGGEQAKVRLCKLMNRETNVLLLDEPTNHLDLDAISWLEEFLINFENTVIVVSHDRYFLNKVCTNIADIDYGKIQLYAGNYDFWYESSQLMVRQMKEANRKKEEKIKELQEFIQRFSANASKSKQATSRKRALEKIQLDEIRPSSRKYPYIDFRPAREIGNEVLTVTDLCKTIDGEKILDHVSFTLNREDKVALVGPNERAKTVLFQILAGEMEPDEGSYKWGLTTTQSYFPKDNTAEFDSDDTIVDWLTQYSPEKDVTYVRGFLGRMLFAGEDGVKKVRVLSGGEKVRCMLSKLMISGANVLMLDEPTDHLDMESITALNTGLVKFPGVLIFSSRDHQIVQTTANRIMEIVNGQLIDKITSYDEYLESDEMARKRTVFAVTEKDD